jgi:hypothetical protein
MRHVVQEYALTLTAGGTMRALRFGIVVAMLGLTACAASMPPVARVTDVAVLAGTYSGSLKEDGVVPRIVRIVLLPNGSFDIAAGEPGGFRYNGRVDAADGGLIYEYERGKGRGVVHEGDGRRVIVFTRADGRETITVDKTLP